jgi:hypothetical protein
MDKTTPPPNKAGAIVTVRGKDMRDGPPCLILDPEFEAWLEAQEPGRSFDLFTSSRPADRQQKLIESLSALLFIARSPEEYAAAWRDNPEAMSEALADCHELVHQGRATLTPRDESND